MRWAERLVAPVVDGLLIAASLWFLPILAAPFVAPHWSSALLVTLAYLGLCAGMWLLKLIERPDLPAPKPVKKQRGKEEDEEEGSGCMGFLSFSFSIFTVAMLLYAMGIAETGPGAFDWEHAPDRYPVPFALGSILMLVWVVLFPMVALFKPKPVIKAGTVQALLARAAGVLAVNAMVLLTAAWWQAALGGSEPMGIALGGRILIFLCFYLVFLMCYAAPRLALIAIDGDRLSLISYLIMLACVVWPLTA